MGQKGWGLKAESDDNREEKRKDRKWRRRRVNWWRATALFVFMLILRYEINAFV
jgi:hypothetical protein